MHKRGGNLHRLFLASDCYFHQYAAKRLSDGMIHQRSPYYVWEALEKSSEGILNDNHYHDI